MDPASLWQSQGPPDPASWLNTHVALRLVLQNAQPPKPEPIAPALSPPSAGAHFYVSSMGRGRAIPRSKLRSRPLVYEAALERDY